MTDKAKEWLAKKGFDPAYSARPLKHLIQKEIQDQLDMKILDGKSMGGDMVTVDADAKKDGLGFKA